MMLRARLFYGALIAVAPLAGPARAQGDARVIPDSATCAACRLAFDTVGSLDMDYLPAVLMHGRIAADSRGWVTVPDNDLRRLSVFRPDGRIGHVVGRRGGGPGEFVGPLNAWIGQGDSLLAFDFGSRRFSVFEPIMGRYIRVAAFPSRVEAVAPFGVRGELFVIARIASAASVGLAGHVVSSEGRIERSVRTGDETVVPTSPSGGGTLLARTSDGCVWTVASDQYVLSQICAPGVVARRLARRPAWFVNSPRSAWSRERPTFPRTESRVLSVFEDGSGLLWVLAFVTTQRAWLPSVRVADSAAAIAARGAIDGRRYVEVINPKSGELVASILTDVPAIAARADLWIVQRDTPDGTAADILRVSLVRQR